MSIESELRESISSVYNLKHPRIDARVRRVLDIIGTSGSISRLYEYEGVVSFTVEWSARSCAQSDDYECPLSIFRAADPERAARIWLAQQEVEESERYVRAKERELSYATDRKAKAVATLDTMRGE